MGWVRRAFGAYFDNATAKKDFRAQLRGNKALLLWGSYIGMLILVAAIVYSGVSSRETMSVSMVQANLRSFYETMMIWLAAIVSIIAAAEPAGPAPMTSTSVRCSSFEVPSETISSRI